VPCDTLQTNSVNVGKLAPSLLQAAAKRQGWDYVVLVDGAVRLGMGQNRQVVYRDGAITSSGYMSSPWMVQTVGEIKRAYSGEVVRYTAARNGWAVREIGVGQFEVVKGGV
jgi:hypothetical protein